MNIYIKTVYSIYRKQQAPKYVIHTTLHNLSIYCKGKHSRISTCATICAIYVTVIILPVWYLLACVFQTCCYSLEGDPYYRNDYYQRGAPLVFSDIYAAGYYESLYNPRTSYITDRQAHNYCCSGRNYALCRLFREKRYTDDCFYYYDPCGGE